MKCDTIKRGLECFLMETKGCMMGKEGCFTIIDKCVGCSRIIPIENKTYCMAYPNPAMKWQTGGCGLATHIIKEKIAEKKLNPIKQSKKSRGKKKK